MWSVSSLAHSSPGTVSCEGNEAQKREDECSYQIIFPSGCYMLQMEQMFDTSSFCGFIFGLRHPVYWNNQINKNGFDQISDCSLSTAGRFSLQPLQHLCLQRLSAQKSVKTATIWSEGTSFPSLIALNKKPAATLSCLTQRRTAVKWSKSESAWCHVTSVCSQKTQTGQFSFKADGLLFICRWQRYDISLHRFQQAIKVMVRAAVPL